MTRREIIKEGGVALTALSLPFPPKAFYNIETEKSANQKAKMIQPFSVNMPQQALNDLKLRLKNTRLPAGN